jgi:DNA-binding Lrp family transcriptional regulator/YHS domain-containing protein
MRTLDDTDMEILSLLAEDARRPFSAIGEAVGLSGPAVSDRVDRLQEAGVITGFTINVDRSKLRAGVPVLVRVTVSSGSLEEARGRIRAAEGVEHVFVTAEGDVLLYARVEGHAVRTWVEGLLSGLDAAEYEVTLVDEAEWTPSVEGLSFALTCAECGNTVDSEGETARIDGETYHFCCGSCLERFEDRYQRMAEGA